MNLKNIGSNVKKLRQKKGLTQFQLAEKAEISTVHMSHIETGSVAMSLECLIAICNALETTPDIILLGEFCFSSENNSSAFSDSIKNLSSDEKHLIVEIANVLDCLKINRK